jgi:hypothetical protein
MTAEGVGCGKFKIAAYTRCGEPKTSAAAILNFPHPTPIRMHFVSGAVPSDRSTRNNPQLTVT